MNRHARSVRTSLIPATVFAASVTAPLLLLLPVSAPAAVTALPEIGLTHIGFAGNAPDGNGYGAVAYSYYIGTTEVTNGQYAAFLNSVAKSDPHGLYYRWMGVEGDIVRSGDAGAYVYTALRPNAPVRYVSFLDAARFCNWLTNGARAGASTETGMYTLSDGGIGMTRSAEAWAAGGYAIPTEDEWYKAAYYAGSRYWPFSTGSSLSPVLANYDNMKGNTTDVGIYPDVELNGTFDMTGNVWEWNEGMHDGAFRSYRGGGYYDLEGYCRASFRAIGSPGVRRDNVGFRIASLSAAVVPEPCVYAVLISAVILGATFLCRRRPAGQA